MAAGVAGGALVAVTVIEPGEFTVPEQGAVLPTERK
jgi:hypothetical protein